MKRANGRNYLENNEESISKLYGVWYEENLSGRLIYFSNQHIRIARTDPSDGDFQIENTTENGGTIYIADFQAEGTHRSAKITFDFGTPGDNKISVTNEAGIRSDYIAAEYLGNNQYRLPTSLNFSGNITTMN